MIWYQGLVCGPKPHIHGLLRARQVYERHGLRLARPREHSGDKKIMVVYMILRRVYQIRA